MLVVRAEQMNVFKEAALRSFKEEMLVHLSEFSPPLFKAVGEAQMRAAIDLGVSRAATYGFTFRGPVRFYLELMLLFGSYFDSDPQYPWAKEILIKKDVEPQMQRAELLYEKTMDYRQKVAGPDNIFTLNALKKSLMLAQMPFPLPSASVEFSPAMLKLIAYVYPQKAAYNGGDGFEALINKGIGGAQRQQLSTVRGKALVIGLMLTFGHGCAMDPLYPWITSILQDETIADPEERVKRLEIEAVAWLKQLQASIDEGSPV